MTGATITYDVPTAIGTFEPLSRGPDEDACKTR